jgi:SnoaL-like domain
MTLDDLLAREGIRDIVARYNANGDTGRFDALWPVFADDAVMELRNADGTWDVYDGIENVKRIFTGAKDRVDEQTATAGPTYIRHFTATHQIDLVDADHAKGRCYFCVIIDNGLDHWGRYVDEYVRVEGQWKFARRQVSVDGRAESSWFA